MNATASYHSWIYNWEISTSLFPRKLIYNYSSNIIDYKPYLHEELARFY